MMLVSLQKTPDRIGNSYSTNLGRTPLELLPRSKSVDEERLQERQVQNQQAARVTPYVSSATVQQDCGGKYTTDDYFENKLMNSEDIQRENMKCNEAKEFVETQSSKYDRGGKYMTSYSNNDSHNDASGQSENIRKRSGSKHTLNENMGGKYLRDASSSSRSQNQSDASRIDEIVSNLSDSCVSSGSEGSIDESEIMKRLSALPDPPKCLPSPNNIKSHKSRQRNSILLADSSLDDSRKFLSSDISDQSDQRCRSHDQNRSTSPKRNVREQSVDGNHNEKYSMDRNEYSVCTNDTTRYPNDTRSCSVESLDSDSSTLITAL